MSFGDTFRTAGLAALFGAIMGLLAVGPCLVIMATLGYWEDRYWALLAIVVLGAMTVVAVVPAVTACFRVRVYGQMVQRVFLNRFVLREYPLAQYVDVTSTDSIHDVVFQGGRRIRLLVAVLDQDELVRMHQHLSDLRDSARPALCNRPSEQVAIDPTWLAWNNGTVQKLAQAIQEQHRFADLPILGDALEDAGCTNAAILGHCREPGQHDQRCWLVNMLCHGTDITTR